MRNTSSFAPRPSDKAVEEGAHRPRGPERAAAFHAEVQASVLPPPAEYATRAAEELPENETRVQPSIRASGLSRSILLVEDNPGDIRLVREALGMGSIPLRLSIAHDGLEALILLQQSGRKPDLILLDLNLPGLDGRTVLHRIKSTPELARIPVIVLSGSNAHQDVWNAYDQHANCYIVKPVDFEEFVRRLRCLVDFWAGAVQLSSG